MVYKNREKQLQSKFTMKSPITLLTTRTTARHLMVSTITKILK